MPQLQKIIQLRRAIQSLQNCIDQLSSPEYQKLSVEFQLTLKAGIIKNFEFVYALLVTNIQHYLSENSADPNKPRLLDFRDMIRLASDQGLVGNPQNWFSWRDFRNKTSHSYNADIADKILFDLDKFIVDAKAVLRELEKMTD